MKETKISILQFEILQLKLNKTHTTLDKLKIQKLQQKLDKLKNE